MISQGADNQNGIFEYKQVNNDKELYSKGRFGVWNEHFI